MKILLFILILLQSTTIQAKQWKWKNSEHSRIVKEDIINEKIPTPLVEKEYPQKTDKAPKLIDDLFVDDTINDQINLADTNSNNDAKNDSLDENTSKQDFIIEKNNENLSLYENEFLNIDKDKNNLISQDEYLFYQLEYTFDEQSKNDIKQLALQFFEKIDTNNDKLLDKKEFITNSTNKQSENMLLLFKMLDKDSNGNLSTTENDINLEIIENFKSLLLP